MCVSLLILNQYRNKWISVGGIVFLCTKTRPPCGRSSACGGDLVPSLHVFVIRRSFKTNSGAAVNLKWNPFSISMTNPYLNVPLTLHGDKFRYTGHESGRPRIAGFTRGVEDASGRSGCLATAPQGCF